MLEVIDLLQDVTLLEAASAEVAASRRAQLRGYDLAIDDTVRSADEVIALVDHNWTEEVFVRTIRPFVIQR